MGALLHRLWRVVREARRKTLLGPLLDAWALQSVLAAIDGDLRDARVLGPDEFSPYVRCLTRLGAFEEGSDARAFEWAIIAQDQLTSLSPSLLHGLRDHYHCAAANRRYLLFRMGPPPSDHRPATDAPARTRLDQLLQTPPAGRIPRLGTFAWKDRAILVTTFERPSALERTLPQLVRLGAPILLVDDGSRDSVAEQNHALAREHGIEYLRLPTNRGISAALNAGMEYLLADGRLDWISYFQDDVDVRPDTLECLSRVEDAESRPLLTGYDADEHPVVQESEIEGVAVRLKRETAGVHLHAHRSYWRAVLPIPTEYLGAPKRRWEGSLEDAWITVGAPKAAARRGIPIVCVPGLVRTFLWHQGDSTWGNPNEPDAVLEEDPGDGSSWIC